MPPVAVGPTRDAGAVYNISTPARPHQQRCPNYFTDDAPDQEIRHPAGARFAVSVDGCFWHSCPDHSHLPETNTNWWRLKFRGTARRARDTDAQLAAAGRLAFRNSEHVDPVEAAQAIEQLVRGRTAEKRPSRTA